MTNFTRRARKSGPTYPIVSWRKKDRDSKIHYQGPRSGFTLCGIRIPRRGVGEGDGVDMCERCVRIAKVDD